jgi:FeS assembly SUF system protein
MGIFKRKKFDIDKLKDDVTESLKGIYDPEIPVNIYDLGLIYNVEAFQDGNVIITMTLTTPNCPVAETMPQDVKNMAESTGGAKSATINLVWDPPWSQDMMTEAARLELGLF